MAKNYINFLHFVSFFIFFALLPSKLSAQCAGDDNINELICDISNPAYQSINLFTLLGGTPVPGGTWTDDNNLKGLDPVTGILNPQLIVEGGTYHYTYTAPTTSGCVDDKAVVTITIGAYAGVGSQATVCNKASTFNLFTAFDSNAMGPHGNGVFTNTITGQIVESVINIADIDQKTTLYYTYTVPPVLACSPTEKSTNIVVTVLRAPKAGTPDDLILCGTTDLGSYTNLDLFDRLTDYDSGGTWAGTGLTSNTDHNINLQELFDTNGPGEYTYTYTVLAVPDNNICKDETASIVITLEKRLDFTGATIVVNKDICESEITTASYSGIITQGLENIPNGEYEVAYNVVGPGVSQPLTATRNFINGVFSFSISSSYFRQVGEYTITVTGIVSTSSQKSCVDIFSPFSTILTIYPLPNLDNAVLTASPVCQNEDGLIEITAPQLLDGNYRITYNINGDNVVAGQTAVIQAVGGKASFTVPGNLNVKSGLSVISILNIVNITNASTQCSAAVNIAGNLIINPLPNAAPVRVTVNDFCLNDSVSASVFGLENLTNASISYMLSGSNSSAVQTVARSVTNGRLNFIIPAGLLVNTGTTKITLLNLTNTITNCDVDLVNVADDFIINPIPPAPTVLNQDFCQNDGATIADLLPKGVQYKWYNSPSLTTRLAYEYVLKTEDYYVTETSAAGCTSEPTKISVTIHPLPNLVNAVLTATSVCQSKDASIEITAPQLLDGNYSITYNINGDNLATGQTALMQATGGKATFTIPGSLNVKSGLSVISILNIVNITNPSPQCGKAVNVAGNLIINPLPNATTVKVAVNDFCLNAPVPALISGLGSLTNVSITYSLSESNSSAVQTIAGAVTDGRLDFTIPAGLLLNSGATKITLLNLTNTATNCDVDLINVTDDFIINPIPDAPIAQDMEFCKSDNATAADLVPSGAEYKWYNSATLTTPLAANYVLKTEDYYVTETSAAGCTSAPTKISVIIQPLPNLDNAVLTATPICIGKEALIEVTAPQLLDGDYRIVYNINGDNVATGQITVMQATGGKASFTISSNLSANAGLSVITIVNIVNITNPFPQCSNTAFLAGNLVINPLPNASTVSVAVNDFCLNDPVSASISGLGNLTNASISYTLSESNSSGVQTISQAVVNGKLDFTIPAGLLLNAGTTKITLLNLINTTTNCDVNLSNVTDDFIINPIPSAPAAQNQKFCKVDEAEVANLVPNGNQYKWYNSPTSTTPLASTLALESGNYYVRETSAEGCTSEATTVLVTIDDSPVPVLNSEGQNFCGLNNPTISDLSNNTNVPSSVVWYDSPNNGNLLSSTTSLIEQGKYYGFNFSSTDCLSSQYIEVTVTLTDCDNVPNDFFIPDGFSPNGDGVNDWFVIKDIEFLYPNYTLEIYNRYGNGMYKGDKNKPAWDGKNYERSGIAGGIAPNGVYFYVLHFNKDNKPPKQGRLYLNR
ncbi:Ig-like domain-containing protein [Flavobacterium ginsenosidimutans]|uniref:Ig-like domain-containing protein n=1 Tax=Flavobacterium ginsenosidimutans TaxID=687844 RepID=UPI001EF43E5F|nr:gliding motility-associated C-terminal domain-containing protein [Flavobacterium ginsenosidimutans]